MAHPSQSEPFPLDLERTRYSYIERPNRVIVSLLKGHVISARPAPRILDVGCGCGANAREVRKIAPHARVTGIEPNPKAAELAREACDEVFEGTLDGWLKGSGQ